MLATRERRMFRTCSSGQSHASPSSGGPVLQPMQTEYAQNMHDGLRKNVLRSLARETVWWESVFDKNTGVVRMVQVYSEKTTTTLKANAIVANPFQLFILNFSNCSYCFLVHREHTLLDLFSVSMSGACHEHDAAEPERENELRLDEEVFPISDYLTSSTTQKEKTFKLKVLHKPIQSPLTRNFTRVILIF